MRVSRVVVDVDEVVVARVVGPGDSLGARSSTRPVVPVKAEAIAPVLSVIVGLAGLLRLWVDLNDEDVEIFWFFSPVELQNGLSFSLC